MSVAVLNGRLPVLGGRLLSASLAGHEKSKQFNPWRANATRGMDILGRMRSHQWMMRAHRFCLVSGVAGIMIARTRDTLSDMKRGNK